MMRSSIARQDLDQFMRMYWLLCPDWDHEVHISVFARRLGWALAYTRQVAEELRSRKRIDTAEGLGKEIQIIEGKFPPR